MPPVAVENVSASAYTYYNLVTWSDIDVEEGETYNVYASHSEITDVTATGVDVIATDVKRLTIATGPVARYLDEPKSAEYFQRAIEELGGASQLLYSSDYPHWDYDPPSAITSIPFLTEKEKELILGKNAQKVFGI